MEKHEPLLLGLTLSGPRPSSLVSSDPRYAVLVAAGLLNMNPSSSPLVPTSDQTSDGKQSDSAPSAEDGSVQLRRLQTTLFQPGLCGHGRT